MRYISPRLSGPHGEWVASPPSIPVSRPPPQGLGSAPAGADTVLGALVSDSTPLWPKLGVPAPAFRMSKLRLREADLSRVPELGIRLTLRLLLQVHALEGGRGVGGSLPSPRIV